MLDSAIDFLRNTATRCVFLLALLSLAGCSYVTISGTPIVDSTGLRGVTPPRSIGVLPTTDSSGHPDLAPTMRQSLHGALSALPLDNRQLSEVDQQLAMIANRLGMPPDQLPPAALANPAVADLVVFSRITRISRLFLLLYSHNRFTLEFQMADTRSRHILYNNKFVITNRNIAPTLDILGLFSSAFRSLWHLREESVRSTFQDGAQKIVAAIPPLPAFSELGNRLAIVKVNVNIPRKTLGVGDRVLVELIGTPKTFASFNVGKVSRRIPMRETAPGRYAGEFVVKKGMNTPYAVVETTLRLPSGAESITDTITDQPFTIDTTPPPQARVSRWWPAGRGDGLYGEIAIDANEANKNPEKSAHYLVYRRSPGQTEFAPIAQTDKTTFQDKTIDLSKPGEYRIITQDAAGNCSEPGPVTRIHK